MTHTRTAEYCSGTEPFHDCSERSVSRRRQWCTALASRESFSKPLRTSQTLQAHVSVLCIRTTQAGVAPMGTSKNSAYNPPSSDLAECHAICVCHWPAVVLRRITRVNQQETLAEVRKLGILAIPSLRSQHLIRSPRCPAKRSRLQGDASPPKSKCGLKIDRFACK